MRTNENEKFEAFCKASVTVFDTKFASVLDACLRYHVYVGDVYDLTKTGCPVDKLIEDLSRYAHADMVWENTLYENRKDSYFENDDNDYCEKELNFN